MRAAHYCFVCGPENPIGLKLAFELHGAGVQAEFTPSEWHVGYEGVVHGGILAALLDDAMANIWFAQGVEALTAKIEVRFRHEVRPGDRLIVRAEPTGKKGGLLTARAEVRRANGVVVADGTGLLVLTASPRLKAGDSS